MITERRGISREAAGQNAAVIRLLAVLTVAVTGEWVPLPAGVRVYRPAFELTLAAAVVWAGVIGWRSVRSARPLPSWVLGAVDVGLLCVLTYESGGAVSQTRKGFFLIPVVVAMQRRPRVTMVWSLVAMGAYLAITLPHPSADGPGGTAGVISHTLFIGLVSAAATLLSRTLAREREHIMRLAADRRQLLGWTLAAEDNARRELAYRLHDGPTQTLLAAVRLLPRVDRGQAGCRAQLEDALRETVSDLRGAIFALHPSTLAEQGLTDAIRLTVTDAAARAGLDLALDLEEIPEGGHDALLFACARELVTNTVKHARATRVEITLTAEHGVAVLAVTDDGVGLSAMPVSRPGHLGLAALTERAAAAGGRVRIGTEATGCSITTEIPILAPAAVSQW